MSLKRRRGCDPTIAPINDTYLDLVPINNPPAGRAGRVYFDDGTNNPGGVPGLRVYNNASQGWQSLSTLTWPLSASNYYQAIMTDVSGTQPSDYDCNSTYTLINDICTLSGFWTVRNAGSTSGSDQVRIRMPFTVNTYFDGAGVYDGRMFGLAGTESMICLAPQNNTNYATINVMDITSAGRSVTQLTWGAVTAMGSAYMRGTVVFQVA